jgi:hypothetical protein
VVTAVVLGDPVINSILNVGISLVVTGEFGVLIEESGLSLTNIGVSLTEVAVEILTDRG